MSVPVAYTTDQLAAYMASIIGSNVAAILGWTAPASYQEMVVDAVLSYGVDDISKADDMLKLRSIARMEVWRAVRDQTSAHYDLTMPDGIRAERNQINSQAQTAYLEARKDAMRHGAGYAVAVSDIRHSDDPFRVEGRTE